jgi:hypothetical protein
MTNKDHPLFSMRKTLEDRLDILKAIHTDGRRVYKVNGINGWVKADHKGLNELITIYKSGDKNEDQTV